jgi:hypothetical protein
MLFGEQGGEMTRSGLIAIVGLGLLCGCAQQLAAENTQHSLRRGNNAM